MKSLKSRKLLIGAISAALFIAPISMSSAEASTGVASDSGTSSTLVMTPALINWQPVLSDAKTILDTVGEITTAYQIARFVVNLL